MPPIFLYDKSLEFKNSFENEQSAGVFLKKLTKLGRYIDTGNLFKDKWYLFSKRLDPNKIAHYKFLEKNVAKEMAKEVLSEQKKTIHVYDDRYEFLYSTKSIHEVATCLNICPTIIKYHLKKHKPLIIKILDKNYYITSDLKINNFSNKAKSEYFVNAILISPTNLEDNECSDVSESCLPLPEPEFLDSIHRFTSNYYTNVYKFPEIFGQMDESALLTMGILMQEYIRNELSNP